LKRSAKPTTVGFSFAAISHEEISVRHLSSFRQLSPRRFFPCILSPSSNSTLGLQAIHHPAENYPFGQVIV